MKKVLLIISLFSTGKIFCQGNVTWKADTIINENGEVTILPEVTFHTIESTERYDSLNNLTWKVEMLSRDTVKEIDYYIDGTIKEEYYIKLSKPIDSILDYNPWMGGYLIRKTEYCENGNVKSDICANEPSYKKYSCDGLLLIEADSTNEFMHPVGTYIHYDSNGNQTIKGIFLSDPKGNFCIEDGWWEFSENGIIKTKKLYKNRILIEEKNF